MKKLLIAASALMAGTAVAQSAPVAPPAPPAPTMAHPMADRVMTRGEAVTMVRDHFGRLDSDRDGAISKTEIGELKMRHHGGRDGAHGMRVHRDRDPAAAFDRLDANKDGSISREEFTKGREERIERRVEIREHRQDGAKDGPRGKNVLRRHRMGGGMMGGRMIVMADTDKDGRITLAEAEAMALQHFDQMDANRDGQVTPEERRAGRPMIIKKIIEQKKTAG